MEPITEPERPISAITASERQSLAIRNLERQHHAIKNHKRQNEAIGNLARQFSAIKDLERHVFAIRESEQQAIRDCGPDWRTSFIEYLVHKKVPGEKDQIKQREELIRRAKNYVVIDNELYRRGASSDVLMRCVEQTEGIDILKKIHSGICGNHAASRTLVGKVFRSGYYWPSVKQDAEELVRRCQGSQFFA